MPHSFARAKATSTRPDRKLLSTQEWLTSFDELKRKKGLLRNDRPLPSFSIELPTKTLAQLRDLSAHFVEALMKVAHQILHQHPAFPSLHDLGFSQKKVQMLHFQLPRHYKETLVLGRLDVTTDQEHFVTYEFNGSQPGGMEFIEIFDHPLFIQREQPAQIEQLYAQYLQNALRFYFRRTGKRTPEGILLLGHQYHLLSTQSEAFRRHLSLPLHVAQDGSNCVYDGSHLLFRDESGQQHSIDLILRSPRASFEKLMEPENAELLRAYKKGHVVVVNPPHAKVVGWKTLYAYLQQDKLLEIADVSEAEHRAIQQMLPTNEQVTTANVEVFRQQKDQWVLKYTLRGRGSMVYLGPETAQHTWDRLIDRASLQIGWVCQRFTPPYCLDITLHDPAHTALHVPVTIDPYVTVGDTINIPLFLCRAVIPTHGDEAELQNVKLNLLGTNLYQSNDGRMLERSIGFGYAYERASSE